MFNSILITIQNNNTDNYSHSTGLDHTQILQRPNITQTTSLIKTVQVKEN